ncbi:type II secretion system F family protein [Metapseudomonas furukawaii]|uniref:Uncharacterized protein n=1 Tax=Metapseudomonas furukawaii TaxID=1149133 RepID=L8MI05_METFU|nr:type II secretion system F family protein [Pseudomonas furukawaii]ELS25345.1 hypothetical protein ppKF707_2248 [Pseudomonas furukawaii]ELS27557.1 PulF protein [Pseudomonas furukawaii]BAU77396.1 hypothetical protein KF707C_p70 [Pseudomonas furukawaii]
MIHDAFASFEEWLVRLQFGGASRIKFYEAMRNLVENQVSANDALKELYGVWSKNGKTPRAALAIITQDLLVQLANGTRLSKALSRWAPYEEVSLIAAGEQAGRLVAAFDDVERVITAKMEIRGAIASALAYPTFLCIPLSVLLYIISMQVVPKMARFSDPETWQGSAYLLHLLAYFVTNFGIAFLCLLAAFVVALIYSLPRLCGGPRILLDRAPFFTTYRMVHGSTFLLNLAVMMRANIPTHDALVLLHQYANPWLQERLNGALYGLRQGVNLGVALENAGHNFPDQEAIQFIRILASREGFANSINKYSERWLQASIKRIKVMAGLSYNVMLILIGLVMTLVVVGTQELQSGMDRTANQAVQNVR